MRKLKGTGVQIVRNRGEHSEKIKKLKEKEQKPKKNADPTQRRWIRIFRTPQRRWIDPDPLNLHLMATGEGKWVGLEPTRFGWYIKGQGSGSWHFLKRFSLFFFSSSPFSVHLLQTLTLKILLLPRNGLFEV